MSSFQRMFDAPIIGFAPDAPQQGMTTSVLNSSSTHIAFGFVAQQAKTLSEVSFYLSATSGSPAAADFEVSLFSNTTTPSGTAIETKTLGSAPTTGWNRVTGWTTTLTAGEHYWFRIKNLNGSPTSNNFTFRFFAGSSTPKPFAKYSTMMSSQYMGWNTITSSNSGSSWSTYQGSNIRIKFSDNTYAGMPISSVGFDSNYKIYGTREAGNRFTTPSTFPTMRVAGLIFPCNKSWSSITGSIKFGLYTGSTPTLLAYTQTLNLDRLTSDDIICLFFDSVQTIAANTLVTTTIAGVSGGNSSDHVRLYKYTIDTDSNSLLLAPFGGCVPVYYDGSSWTTESSSFFPGALLLDATEPFASSIVTNNIFTIME